jgi:hypothetical protein
MGDVYVHEKYDDLLLVINTDDISDAYLTARLFLSNLPCIGIWRSIWPQYNTIDLVSLSHSIHMTHDCKLGCLAILHWPASGV